MVTCFGVVTVLLGYLVTPQYDRLPIYNITDKVGNSQFTQIRDMARKSTLCIIPQSVQTHTNTHGLLRMQFILPVPSVQTVWSAAMEATLYAQLVNNCPLQVTARSQA